MQALEYSQKHERIPSCILAVGEGSAAGTGGLYHGGFKAIMNAEFLRKERVTHIVNTAKGLEIFGPKYLVGFSLFCNMHSKCRLATLSQQEAVERAKSQLGIMFLELNWEDTVSFNIPDEDLIQCVKLIHSARTSGGSVLVHCAQVRVLGIGYLGS